VPRSAPAWGQQTCRSTRASDREFRGRRGKKHFVFERTQNRSSDRSVLQVGPSSGTNWAQVQRREKQKKEINSLQYRRSRTDPESSQPDIQLVSNPVRMERGKDPWGPLLSARQEHSGHPDSRSSCIPEFTRFKSHLRSSRPADKPEDMAECPCDGRARSRDRATGGGPRGERRGGFSTAPQSALYRPLKLHRVGPFFPMRPNA